MFKLFRVGTSLLLLSAVVGSIFFAQPASAATNATYRFTGSGGGSCLLTVAKQCDATTFEIAYKDPNTFQNSFDFPYVTNSKYVFGGGLINPGSFHVSAADPGHGSYNDGSGKIVTLVIDHPEYFTAVFKNGGKPADPAKAVINVTSTIDFGKLDATKQTGPLTITLDFPGSSSGAFGPTQAALTANIATLTDTKVKYQGGLQNVGPGPYTICAKANFLLAIGGQICKSITKNANAALSVDLSGKGDSTKLSDVPTSNTEVCSADGAVGWILCGLIIEPTIKVVNGIKTGFIDPFLHVTPLKLSPAKAAKGASVGPTVDPIYNAWSSFKTLANILFVLIFLAVIFGTVLNLDAYTVKKALPRLVIAAIAIQISYFLVAAAIDTGNILGAGLNDLIPKQTISLSHPKQDLIGLGAVGAAGAAIVVSAVIPAVAGLTAAVAIGALIAFLGIFAVLILRQALILLLVVLSPIAIIAWVLPNTQSLAKMWFKNLIRLILLFPIIDLLFIAGGLFSAAAAQITPTGAASTTITDLTRFPLVLAGLILPLFLIPATFKMAGTLMSKGGGAISNLASKGSAKIKGSDSAKRAQEDRRSRGLQKMKDSDKPFGSALNRAQAGFGFGRAPRTAQAQNRLHSAIDGHEKAQVSAADRQTRGKSVADLQSDWSGGSDAIQQSAFERMAEDTTPQGATNLQKMWDEGQADPKKREAIRKAIESKPSVKAALLAKAPHMVGEGGLSAYHNISAEGITALSPESMQLFKDEVAKGGDAETNAIDQLTKLDGAPSTKAKLSTASSKALNDLVSSTPGLSNTLKF